MTAISRTSVGVYSVMGGAVFSLALPWLPEALSSRVRGALAQDIASKHGLSLSPDARKVLATPGVATGSRTIVQQALRLGATRLVARLTPLVNVLPPLMGFVSTFALGHLLERYLSEQRTDTAIRIDEAEARRVRSAIDRAVARLLRPRSRTRKARLPHSDDARDVLTQLLDTVIGGVAGVPSWLALRLEHDFDEALRGE